MIRDAKTAFKDFMDPSVMFIFGSIVIGMAFVAGAGSMITLSGAARGAVTIGFYNDIAGKDISFFELTKYMFPICWLMVFPLRGFFMVFYKPEKRVIPGLREKAKKLYAGLGPVTIKEWMVTIIVAGVIIVMACKAFIPSLAPLNKTAIVLVSTLLFFLFKIMDIIALEDIPWNIILLFAGAMSIGFCLWETDAAKWMAVNWLTMFKESSWFIFVLGISFFVMIMTNFIMNVTAIAISLPVALVIAPYLGVAPEVILFASLIVSACPFLLLVGAAPNAIAYDSKQFTTGEFFLAGDPGKCDTDGGNGFCRGNNMAFDGHADYFKLITGIS